MKYQDDLINNTVNGFQTGIKPGSPIQDALAPEDDGYDHLRSIEHVGAVLQDADPKAVNPTLIV